MYLIHPISMELELHTTDSQTQKYTGAVNDEGVVNKN